LQGTHALDFTFSLTGKVAAVLGVHNQESVAWAVARNLSQAGANVVVGYRKSCTSQIFSLLRETPTIRARSCNPSNPIELFDFFQQFEDTGLDILVHAADNSSTFFPSYFLKKVVQFAVSFLKPRATILALLPGNEASQVTNADTESMVRHLAIQFQDSSIRINGMSTHINQPKRAIQQISRCALFLSSDASQSLNGQIMRHHAHEWPIDFLPYSISHYKNQTKTVS